VGNRTSVRTPAGVTNYEYDEQNRLEKVTDPDSAVTNYFYDANGNLSTVELPNGVVETRRYDNLNRLKLLQYQKNDVTIQSFDYTLDLAGHRQVVTEQNRRKVEYEYDDLYRLTKETIFAPTVGIEKTISYGYDAVGNRLSKSDSVGGVTTYTYDDNDRLKREELRQNGALVGSVEDDNGNTWTKTKKDVTGNVVETVTYDWNQENRLVGVSAPNLSISYEYDADGVRVSKTVNRVTTEFLVDKNRDYAQVLEESVNGVVAASYVYGLDLISQERGSADSFYLVDGLGSTRGLTDGAGNVTDTYSYDAFGNLIASAGNVENNYLFAGEQFDEDLEQYYLRQRYYNPSVGRFTRVDSYEGRRSDPMSRHDYLYTHANPINFTDPSGLYTLGEHQAAISIINTLAEIQWASGQQLIAATLHDGDYGLKDFLTDLAWNAAFILIPPAIPYLARRAKARPSNIPPSGAKGPVSKRDFDPDSSGGPVKKLSMSNVKITRTGIEKVKEHVSRFGYDPDNDYMIKRLEAIAAGSMNPTQVDLNYYTHELRERIRYKKLGYSSGQPADQDAAHELWNNAHTATLEEYAVRDKDLLHPQAIKASEEYWLKMYQ